MVDLRGKAKLVDVVEPEEGKIYIIGETEQIKTPVQGFTGLRISMKSIKKDDDEQYATVLWLRDEAGKKSKLGAFLDAFGTFFDNEDEVMETENWVGHEIRFISWMPKKREIAVIK